MSDDFKASVPVGDRDNLELFSRMLDSDRGDQKDLYLRVKDYINGYYAPHHDHIFSGIISNFSEEKESIPIEQSDFTHQVVRELAQVYHASPSRRFTLNGEPVNESTQSYIDSIYAQLGNTGEQELNRYVKGLGHCEYQVILKPDGVWDFRILTPDLFDVVADPMDYDRRIALIYEIEPLESADKDTRRYVYWSDESHFTFKVKTENIKNRATRVYSLDDLIDNTANPYKVIPSLRVTQAPPQGYYCDGNARRFDNIEKNSTLKLTARNELFLFQTMSVMTYTTDNPEQSQSLTISPRHVRVLQKGNSGESDDRIDFVSPSDFLGTVENSLQSSMRNALSKFGIGGSEGNVSANMSGVSIVVSQDRKNKEIRSDESIYRKFERDRWELIKKINNEMTGLARGVRKIDDGIEIGVDFAEIKAMPTLSERAEWEAHNIDNGLMTKAEILSLRDPDAPAEEIERMVQGLEEEYPNINAF